MTPPQVHRCANPAQWHPTLHAHQDHHHPPLSWRRDLLAADPATDQTWWAIVPLCGLCHDEYHTLLNAYVRLGAPPPWADRQSYGTYVRTLVAEAWSRGRVPGARMPYTVAQPEA